MSKAIKCSRCQEAKDPEHFYKNKSRPDGHDNCCKSCRRIMKQGRDYTMKTERRLEQHRQAVAKYRELYPEKELAHRLAAKNKHKIMKSACEECGATTQLHMHHPDYDKPLEVVTLCTQCHANAHYGVAV